MSLTVRAAVEADTDSVAGLVASAAEQRSGHPSVADRIALAARVHRAIADPHATVLVAESDGAIVGTAVVTITTPGPLSDVPVAQLAHLTVAEGSRGRGAGRALVAAAAARADDAGVGELVVSVPNASREHNRFFARLGFAPVVVRRAAPVPVILARLAGQRRRPVDELTRRRMVRRATPGAPAIVAGTDVG